VVLRAILDVRLAQRVAWPEVADFEVAGEHFFCSQAGMLSAMSAVKMFERGLRNRHAIHFERFDPHPVRLCSPQAGPLPAREREQERKPERPRSASRCHRMGVVRHRTDFVGKLALGLGPPRSTRHGKSGDCLSILTVWCRIHRHRSPNRVAWRFPDWTAVGFRCPGPVPRFRHTSPSVTRRLTRLGSGASVIEGLSPRGPMRHWRRR